ncbi:hypothetical protein EPO04_04180 [Patescibacteria group bacterium]|nr:MAG: hypothetical protein EPO04_04180 [Patescibacteria group bacterium]
MSDWNIEVFMRHTAHERYGYAMKDLPDNLKDVVISVAANMFDLEELGIQLPGAVNYLFYFTNNSDSARFDVQVRVWVPAKLCSGAVNSFKHELEAAVKKLLPDVSKPEIKLDLMIIPFY